MATETLNTGLSSQQIMTAFDRALNDYSDEEIDALLSAKAAASDVSDLTTWESYECLSATGQLAKTYIDSENSSVVVKINRAQKRVVIAATLKVKADWSSSVNEFQVASLSAITGYADMVPLVPMRYIFASKSGQYTFGAQRANNSAVCSVWVIDGTIAENSTIYFSFEYTYF